MDPKNGLKSHCGIARTRKTFRSSVIKVDNGVDLSRFNSEIEKGRYRNKFNLDQSHFIYGMIGSIEQRKNSEMFIKVASKIAKKYTHARFIIAGGGDTQYIEKIKAITTQLELSEKVFFTGSVWDTPELMASLDVLAMPSEWEGFPRVVVESMAVGTPVIASDVGDVNYILHSNENGIVMQELNETELFKEMKHVIENPNILKRMGDNALKKCHSQFSQKLHVDRMQGIFSEVLQ